MDMKCIYCHSKTQVTNSRSKTLDSSVWRRRQCTTCQAEFSSIELPDYSKSLVVKSTSGKLFAFSRDKLFLSLHKALGHRQDVLNSASAICDTVVAKLIRQNNQEKGLIKASSLARTAHETLKRFDSLAASTYKAYHRHYIN